MNFLAKNIRVLRDRMGLSQGEMAEKMDFKRSTWASYELLTANPSIDDIIRIANFFDVTIDSLMTKDLSSIADNLVSAHVIDRNIDTKKEDKSASFRASKYASNEINEPSYKYQSRMPQVISTDLTGIENIIFVPIKARAGYLNGYADPEFIQTLPTCRLPGLTNGTFRMFEIEGHSMIPTFNESDRLVGRFIDDFSQIRDNRVYSVLTKRDGMVVKRVVNRLSSDGKLILNSDNQRHAGEYPPIVLNPEDVLEIWYGVMYISRQMREPSDLYTRITDLESRLTLWEQGHRKISK